MRVAQAEATVSEVVKATKVVATAMAVAVAVAIGAVAMAAAAMALSTHCTGHSHAMCTLWTKAFHSLGKSSYTDLMAVEMVMVVPGP